MAIKITDNFQVNIKNPIDNRFVVGSQSIPGGPGSIYPTPFYAYRDDISSNIGFVYPGLRIWDFNDNLPYVWTGTTWSNENLTGASVLNSGDPGFSAGNGYRNYITKFYDTSTVLTKSLLFDNNVHVGLGITSSINPNTSGGAGDPPLNTGAQLYGLHVSGRIRTNTGFIGNGSYIHNINAANINGGPGSGSPGRLALQWINTNPQGPINTSPTNTNPTFVLTTNGVNTSTIWQDILNVAPVYSPFNLGTTNPGAVSLYSGTNPSSQLYEFFSLVSSGLQIDSAVNGSVRIESKMGSILPGGSASVYKGLNSTTKLHEFRTIKSDFMNISEDNNVVYLNSNITSSSLQVNPNGPHGITIEIPASFEGTDYYVNGSYPLEVNGVPNVELGTRSKPFRTLNRCLNKILNRPSGALAGGVNGHAGASPRTDDSRNGGNPWPKYHNRGGEVVRVIIQTYCRVTENLAINNVTYFLESETNSSLAVEHTDFGLGDNAPNLEWVIDMKELSDDITPSRNPDGSLPYPITTSVEGSGRIYFGGPHIKRKGFFRCYATNGYDYLGKSGQGSGGSKAPQHSSQLLIGSKGGKLILDMNPLLTSTFPIPPGQAGSHISSTFSLTGPTRIIDTTFEGQPYNPNDADTKILFREQTEMVGFKSSSEPDYGCIQTEGRNFPYYESLFLKGEIVINAQEQHMMYFKDYGTGYSEDCRIYMRRSYQRVLVDNVQYPFKYVQISGPTGNLIASGYGVGTYLMIMPPSSGSGTGNVNWNSIAVPNSFRNPNNPVGTATGTPAVGWVFKWNGTGNSATLGTSRVAECVKQYLPCKNVYDIYLKRGGRFNHGGDFYTQQNTTANQGGPDSFACLRNDIPRGGSIISTNWYPQDNGSPSTMCEFRATGGGFITSLIYNHYVKTIYDTSYGMYERSGILFRNLKIDSWVYTSVLRSQKVDGSVWQHFHEFGRFFNCLFSDLTIPYSRFRANFSSPAVYTPDNFTTFASFTFPNGKISLGGTRIDLFDAVLDVIIRDFGANANSALAAATAEGLSSGCLYKTGGVIKVIP